ncbi:MAG: hypothetical protein Q4C85_02945 [Actinomyces sp.]|uniref:hypothetical protein n=1 Tax=Actinomyces sp. TaxID=29317 RepID=UPI0026DB871F|nr:hypothetical protein [Actinomyces sp.]MDO4242711.1 hypothetical protein [Actinomyces sp.]
MADTFRVDGTAEATPAAPSTRSRRALGMVRVLRALRTGAVVGIVLLVPLSALTWPGYVPTFPPEGKYVGIAPSWA